VNAQARRAGDDARGSGTVKGALLIFVAVAIGIGLLANSFAAGSSGGGGAPPIVDGVTTSIASDTTGTTGAPTVGPHTPALVKVYVLNGSGLVGVAQEATDILNGRNYTTIPPANAPSKVPASRVYFLESYQADAEAIAGLLGLVATAVEPMPAAPPITDLAGANVVVILGPDFEAA
jgi:hypothetical protein